MSSEEITVTVLSANESRVHELKTWPEFFKLVWRGEKPFELRYDDRGFRAGDKVALREYVKRDDLYTGRIVTAPITCVVQGFPGLERGYVILGLDMAHAERRET